MYQKLEGEFGVDLSNKVLDMFSIIGIFKVSLYLPQRDLMHLRKEYVKK